MASTSDTREDSERYTTAAPRFHSAASKPTIPAVSPIHIQLNGEPREVEGPASIADLLRQLGLDRQACAVEVNLALIPRSRHSSHMLAEGDRLEVVSLVGGG